MAATGMTKLVLFALVMSHFAHSSAWRLVLVHSNDILFQLDEIRGDNSVCYKPLPTPSTSTTIIPTTESTTTPTTESTTTPTTESTITSTSESITTPTKEPATTGTPTESTTSQNESTPTTTTNEPTNATMTDSTVSTPVPTTFLPTTDSSDEASQSTDSNTTVTELRFQSEYSMFPGSTPSPKDDSVSVRNSESPILEDFELYQSKRIVRSATRDDECYGGVARHLTKKEELKKGNENNTVYLNAGGMLGGNVWYPILGADPATVAFSYLKYDAVALGHRDFDEGLAVTIEYLKRLKSKGVKVLCTNMDVSEEPAMKDLFEKSTIKTINGRRIGIVGFIGTDAEVIADTGKVKFLDEVESINSEIQKLFEQGVKFIIALGSADHRKAQDMLAKLYDVDVIVGGGGPDVFYYNGNRGPLGENVTGSYPVVASNQSKRLFVQTSRYGKYLGFLNIDINENGQIDSYDGNPVLLSSTTEPDPTLQGQVDDWEREVLTKSEEVIGSTKVPIVTNRHICWYSECSGGNLMADAARWYLETKHQNSTNWENSVAAAVWHGGSMVHTALTDTIGQIKFGDILLMFPFANTLSTVKMNGQDVKKLMELSIENYNTSVRNLGEFLQVSGMRVEFNLSAPVGERVSRLTIRNTNSHHGDWSDIDLNGRYKIVMPSFIARGGSRYTFLENLDSEDTGIRDEIALKSYIQWMSPLSYGKEERIRFITPTPTVECESYDTVGTVFLTIFLTLLVVGILFAGYKFLYPKIRDRSGSVLSLVR